METDSYSSDLRLARSEFVSFNNLPSFTLALPFNDYARVEQTKKLSAVCELMETSLIFEVNKNLHEPVSAFKYRNEPNYHYTLSLGSSYPLPILKKIRQKVLALTNYRADPDQVQAFAKAVKISDSLVEKVLVSESDFGDENLFTLFNSLKNQKKFKEIHLKSENLGHLFIDAVSYFISRKSPSNLQVLRLINCKISGNESYLLMQLIGER